MASSAVSATGAPKISEVGHRVLWGNRFFPFVPGTLACPRVVNPSSGLGGLEGRQKMSEGCNPSSGKGVWGAANLFDSVCLSVCGLFVHLCRKRWLGSGAIRTV